MGVVPPRRLHNIHVGRPWDNVVWLNFKEGICRAVANISVCNIIVLMGSSSERSERYGCCSLLAADGCIDDTNR